MSFLLTLISWLLMGWLTSHLAQKRGRDPLIWFFIGLFLGLLGLILLFLLPNSDSKGLVKLKENEAAASSPQVIETSAELIKPQTDNPLYYLDKNREQKGPISFSLFKQDWREGKIEKNTYVWREGQTNWEPVQNLPDLIKSLDQ